MFARKIALLTVVSVLTAPLLVACSSDSGSNGSSEEITLYSGRGEYLVGSLFDQFTEETGIKVNARYGGSAELAAQMLEEGDKSPAQVYLSQDSGALGTVEGILATLPADIINLIPKSYSAVNDTWIGVTGRARVIAYDSETVTEGEVPTSVFDLTDEKWRGQVGIAPANASFQSFITAMRITEGEEATRKWLEDLIANDVQKYEKNGLILDAVDSGQVELGLINHYYWFRKAAEVGEDSMRAQISFADPKDPLSLINVSGVGLLKKSQENPNAIAFVKWLMSKETQEWFANTTYEYPLLPAAEAAEGLPAMDSLLGPDIDLAQLSDLPATLKLLQDVGLI